MWWEAWNDFETSVACNTLNALTPSRWGKEPYFQLWFYLLLTVLSFALCECGNEWTPFWRKLISNKLRMISEMYLLFWELCERKEKKIMKLIWVTHYVYSRMTFTLQRSGQKTGVDREIRAYMASNWWIATIPKRTDSTQHWEMMLIQNSLKLVFVSHKSKTDNDQPVCAHFVKWIEEEHAKNRKFSCIGFALSDLSVVSHSLFLFIKQ